MLILTFRSKKSTSRSGRALSLTLGLALGLAAPTLSADVLPGRDVFSLLRAERDADVARILTRRDGRSQLGDIERYALARAQMRQSPPRRGQGMSALQAEAYRNYLRVMGAPNCVNSARTGSALAACAGKLEKESRGKLLQRLAIWRAATAAEKQGLPGLAETLLSRANLSIADPLSESLLSDRLKLYVQRSQITPAVELASRVTYGALNGAQANLWRARSFMKAAQREREIKGTPTRELAFQYYVRAMRAGQVVWVQRAIAQDLRRNFPERLRIDYVRRAENAQQVRDLVSFSGYLQPGDYRVLKTALPFAKLRATSSATKVRTDGIFLIETGQASALTELGRAAYTYLSHTPSILLDWTNRLRRKQQPKVALRLLGSFRHVLPQSASLWRDYIELLEKHGDRRTYFDQLLAYQNRYHAHFSMADRLIEVLIGDNPAKIKWAPASYWERARRELKGQTGNGRFVYWLKRYYLHTKNTAGQKSLKQDFYAMAPGSFYAGAFWEDFNPDGDKTGAVNSGVKDAHKKAKQLSDTAARRDWRGVRDRASYLRWVARHGGNPAAVRFLKGQDRSAYLDPDAVALWRKFARGDYRSPADLRVLYRLGERQLGARFFDHRYEGRVSRREQLAREAYLGYEAGWLHMSVYFTRQFVRDAGIPEDPFSMPEGLLKALYPRPYYPYVNRYASQYSIDSGMVYALMRQESMFREQAISRSGARGLMQIMPATGKWLAGKMKISRPNLMDPRTNINMGARFFSDLVRTQGDFRWASIAYNGGPGNLRKWKRRYYTQDDFYFFLENLPIEEPRNYCRVTFQNFMHYRTTYTLYPE